MVSRPGTGYAVPRRLAAVGEVATMATTLRRLLVSMRADRESRLTRVVPSALDPAGEWWPPAATPAGGPAQHPWPPVTPWSTRTSSGTDPALPALPALPAPPGQPALPVLLVHGYLGTPACWDLLVPRLHGAGFADVFTFGYNALASTIPLLAADVVRAADQVMGRTGANDIHLVGHSLGGLVIRYAVQRLGLSAAADAVVTIATPHRGCPLATVAPGAAGAQMRPGSALLLHLPPLPSTSGVRWLVVDSDQDLVVSPSMPLTTDNRPDGPTAPTRSATGGGPVTYVVVSGGGHQSVLRSDHVRETVVRHLRGSSPRQPTAGRAAAAA